ncbi:MAG: ParB N-terminal domain-containing protein [Dokdonella sp.]
MSAPGSTSKRMRFAGNTQAVQGVSALLEEQSANEPQGTLDSIPLALVVFDPDQPRTLHLSRSNPSEIADDDPDGELKRQELEKLLELAASIREHGVIQPVGVFRHGHEYRLIWGERRVLGSVLASKETVLARIYPERPAQIRAQQLIENVMREGLPLSGVVRGVINLIEEAKKNGEPMKTATDLMKKVGWGKSTAYAYWGIANGPTDVRQAVDDGSLTNFLKAYAIANIDSASERKAAIEAARTGEPQPAVETPKPPPKKTVKVAAKRGRPVTAIPLGKTKSAPVARYIAERLLDAAEFAPFLDADWSDMKTASDILRQVLKRIEQKVLIEQKASKGI